MRLLRHRAFGQRAGAVAAALLVAGHRLRVDRRHPRAERRRRTQRAREGAARQRGRSSRRARAPSALRCAGPNRIGMPARTGARSERAAADRAHAADRRQSEHQGLQQGPEHGARANRDQCAQGPARASWARARTARRTRNRSIPTRRISPNAAKSLNPGAAQTKSANVGPNSRFGNTPGNRAFGNQPGSRALGGPGSRGFTHRDPRMRAVNAATPQLRQVQRFTHRSEMFAIRARMPRYPLPGERNFTGVPPVGETRFVTTEMVCQWGPDISPQRDRGDRAPAQPHDRRDAALGVDRRHAGSLPHRRQSRAPRDVVRAMEAERIVSQPNYVYEAVQEPRRGANCGAIRRRRPAIRRQQAAARRGAQDRDRQGRDGRGDRLRDRRRASRNSPRASPSGSTRVGKPDKPHTHGTGMAGAIVSQDRLMGVAPGARALAVHAFSTGHAAVAAGDDAEHRRGPRMGARPRARASST